MSTITSQNAIVMLSVPDVFPIPQVIEGFEVDSMFMSDEVELAEVRQGADGQMAQGKVPYLIPINLTLMANSPSIDIFNLWINFIQKQDVVNCTLIITLISNGRIYTFGNGALKSGKIMPDGKKVLEGQSYKLVFPGNSFTVVGV